MKRLLYISPGPVPPSLDKSLNKFMALSEILTGDVLEPIWWNSDKVGIEKLGKDNYPNYQIGNFTYRLFPLDRYPKVLKKFVRIFFYILKARKLIKENGSYDYIMTYGTNSTGLAACIIKLLYGGKLIVEIPGVPEDGSLYDKKERTIFDVKNQIFNNLMLYLVGIWADIFKLLYKNQLHRYPVLKDKLSAIFHDFVPTQKIEMEPIADMEYTVLIGYPWYRKGADLLIKAFHQFLLEYPETDFKIKIIGWITDPEYLIECSKGDKRIEIIPPAPQSEIFKYIANSSFLTIPSRSEAMGRVVLEAMAASKAVLGSNVNGIPTYVTNNETGLLFKSDDVNSLYENLKLLILDKELRQKLGQNAYKVLNKEHNEKAYVKKFKQMLYLLDNK